MKFGTKQSLTAFEKRTSVFFIPMLLAVSVLVGVTAVPSTGVSETCDPGYPHSDVNCLHGWWNNNPGISSGVWGGATWGMQNYCSKYGKIRARLVRSGAFLNNSQYLHYTLSSSSKKRGKQGGDVDVLGIYCCRNNSEICDRTEVEKSGGQIHHFRDGQYILVDVSTHKKRYQFCKKYPKGIYCKHNPDGDAFTKPVEALTVEACEEAWDDSAAAGVCELASKRVSSDVLDRPTCLITTECPDDAGVTRRWSTEHLPDDMSSLVNCDGQPKVSSCD